MFSLKISSPTSVGVFQGHTLNVFSSHAWGLSVVPGKRTDCAVVFPTCVGGYPLGKNNKKLPMCVFSSHMWGLSVPKCLYSVFLTSVGILILNNFLYFPIDFSKFGCYNKRVKTLNFEICGCGGIGRRSGLHVIFS